MQLEIDLTIATLAGVASTVLFASSMLPMLLRAARTKDVSSYSRSHLVLTTVGNIVHTVYVFHLPPGPIWALHVFYLVSTVQMLRWHLRHPQPSSSFSLDRIAASDPEV